MSELFYYGVVVVCIALVSPTGLCPPRTPQNFSLPLPDNGQYVSVGEQALEITLNGLHISPDEWMLYHNISTGTRHIRQKLL